MPDHFRWRDLFPGIAALVALIVGTLAVLAYARVGALHGDTFALYAAGHEARAVLSGTEVWLNGKKIGRVTDVHFGPVSADTNVRVIMVLDVLESARELVRHNAHVQVMSGGSFLGAPVVSLEGGTPSAPPVGHGDTLLATPQEDIEGAQSKFGGAANSMPVLMKNVAALTAQLKAAQALVSSTMPRSTVTGAQRVMTHASEVANGLSRGVSGSQGASPAAVMARARQTMARVDSVRTLLASPGQSSLGRFRRDSTLLPRIAGLRDEVSIVRARIMMSDGTLGRLATDSAVTRGLMDAERELGLLLADIKRRPLRYLSF